MIEITSHEFSDPSFSFIWSLWPGSDEVINVMIIIRIYTSAVTSLHSIAYVCYGQRNYAWSYAAAIPRHFVLPSITADQTVYIITVTRLQNYVVWSLFTLLIQNFSCCTSTPTQRYSFFRNCTTTVHSLIGEFPLFHYFGLLLVHTKKRSSFHVNKRQNKVAMKKEITMQNKLSLKIWT